MKRTKIQWCDDTVNPTSGCDGCELWTPGEGGPCYAGNLHEKRLSRSLPLLYSPNFNEVRLIPGRVAKAARCMDLHGRDRPDKPWLNGYRRLIFVGDMGDIFSEDVPFEHLKTEIIDVARNQFGRRHIFQLLTKQPSRAIKFANWLSDRGESWPDNIWAGTSITNRASLGRIKHLVQVPARHRYLSIEPMIEDPAFTPEILKGIDWMIVGGETDQDGTPSFIGRPFDLIWARKVLEIGRACEIAVFIKQFGSHTFDNGHEIHFEDRHGGEWDEWPDDLRVRELPDEGPGLAA